MYAKKENDKSNKKKKSMLCYVVSVSICLAICRITKNASFSIDDLKSTLNLLHHRRHHHHPRLRTTVGST